MKLAAAVTMLAVAVLLVAERRGSRAGVWISKPLASLGFIVTAWLAGAQHSAYGRWLLVALVLCAVGDVLLIPQRSTRAFLLGVAGFALAHGAYARAFVVRGVALPASAATAALMAVVVLATLRWLRDIPADMRVPVRVYMAVIAIMVAAAAGTSAARSDPRFVLGAAAFAISDLSVARERFVRPGFVNLVWGLPLYYAAQLWLAFTAA